MHLTSKKNIRSLLKKHKIRPSKRLGQNFLIDDKVVKEVITAANLQPKDIILEIGPGIGVLTQELAKKVYPVKSREAGIPLKAGLFNGAGKIIAVEKDQRMVEILKETLKDFKNVEVIQGDILRYRLYVTSYKIIANLPFYITAPVIRKFLEAKQQPKEMILIVQKEVAQRICAAPPKMSILAVSVQFYAKAKIISYIPKKSFWPQPKVDGAVIKITSFQKSRGQASTDFANAFFRIVKAGFSHPRKQLANNLSEALKLDKQELNSLLLKNHIQPTQRAETLSIDDWIKLTKVLK